MALSLNQKKKKKKERKQDLSKEGRVSQFRFYKISHFFFNLISRYLILTLMRKYLVLVLLLSFFFPSYGTKLFHLYSLTWSMSAKVHVTARNLECISSVVCFIISCFCTS